MTGRAIHIIPRRAETITLRMTAAITPNSTRATTASPDGPRDHQGMTPATDTGQDTATDTATTSPGKADAA